jgi:hypothetical protein
MLKEVERLRRPAARDRSKMNRIALLSYIVVSIACFRAANYPAAKLLIEQCWSWVWLLGPPITLIYQTAYWWAYAAGSTLLIALVIAGERAWERRPGVTLMCLGLAIAVWCVCGALVYAPTV